MTYLTKCLENLFSLGFDLVQGASEADGERRLSVQVRQQHAEDPATLLDRRPAALRPASHAVLTHLINEWRFLDTTRLISFLRVCPPHDPGDFRIAFQRQERLAERRHANRPDVSRTQPLLGIRSAPKLRIY